MPALRLIAALLLLSSCRQHGGLVSLATPEVRLIPDELVGTWRAPDALRCVTSGEQRPTRFAWPYVFTVDTFPRGWRRAGNLSLVGVPDLACSDAPPDTLGYVGTLVGLGGRRLLEFRVRNIDESMVIPLFIWMRLGTRGDTVFLERLDTDSLGAWLERSPSLTPHRVLDDDNWDEGGTVVLTGDAKQLQDFVRKAFARPAMVSPDTLVFIRDRPEHSNPPPS